MADTTLKTDYKDDVLDTSKNTRRKYQMIQNDDGTVSFVDVTEYSQVGDSFSAADINATNEAVGKLNTNKEDKGKQLAYYSGNISTGTLNLNTSFDVSKSVRVDIEVGAGTVFSKATTTRVIVIGNTTYIPIAKGYIQLHYDSESQVTVVENTSGFNVRYIGIFGTD